MRCGGEIFHLYARFFILALLGYFLQSCMKSLLAVERRLADDFLDTRTRIRLTEGEGDLFVGKTFPLHGRALLWMEKFARKSQSSRVRSGEQIKLYQ